MLGVPTGMVTMVGDDGFGKETIANFQSHGVDTSNVLTTDAQPSGCAPILVDDDGNNCIVVCAAANMVLTPDDVCVCGWLRRGRFHRVCVDGTLVCVGVCGWLCVGDTRLITRPP